MRKNAAFHISDNLVEAISKRGTFLKKSFGIFSHARKNRPILEMAHFSPTFKSTQTHLELYTNGGSRE